ncbi:MAG: hypothetical protein WCE82_06815 [Halobacteriota archaeon]
MMNSQRARITLITLAVTNKGHFDANIALRTKRSCIMEVVVKNID